MNNLEIIEYFNKISNKLRDNNSKLLSLISYLILHQTRNRFDTEKDPSGSRWEKNSVLTIEKYFARTGRRDKKILTDYGVLKLIETNLLTKNNAIIGTKTEYGKITQYGNGKVPARPYLGVNERNIQEIVGVITSYLKE